MDNKRGSERVVDFNDQCQRTTRQSSNIRQTKFKNVKNTCNESEKKAKEQTGIARRLRTRQADTAAVNESKKQPIRQTRSMMKLKTTNRGNSRYAHTSTNTQQKKRDVKSLDKDFSSSESEIEELKYSQRDMYFDQGNSVYQEYDDFLKKRRKDRRVEFFKIKSEPDEEVLSFTNTIDLLKYFGAPNSEQDTF